jgi:hypothetical protein
MMNGMMEMGKERRTYGSEGRREKAVSPAST